MEGLGINLGSMFIYSLLFLVIYFIAKRSFIDKMISEIEKRADEIEKTDQLRNEINADVKKQSEMIKETYEQQISEARLKAEDIVIKAEEERKMIVEKAKLEGRQIIENAKLFSNKAR